MPKTNLPVGVISYFVPAADGSWGYLPAASWGATFVRTSAGLYHRDTNKVAGTEYATLNLTQVIDRALGAYAAGVSANVPEGVEVRAGLLTAIDIVYAITGAAMTSLTPTLYETYYQNGVVPVTKGPGAAPTNIPQFVLTPATLPATVNVPAGATVVQRLSLADYWLLGQNLSDAIDNLEIAIVDPGTTPVFALYGAEIYFSGTS